MLTRLLFCGLLAGACAGLLAAGFSALVGEPTVEAALAFERAQAPPGEPADQEVVARGLQGTAGLLTAAVVYGVALGGLFALAFAAVYGRVGASGPGPTALWLAAAAFVVLFLVPFVGYPANPPATGAEDTVGQRTLLFFSMMAISVLSAIAAVRLRRAAVRRWPVATATGIAVAAYLGLVVAAGSALPDLSEVPRDFPPTVLWEFRQASIGAQLVMWATIGVVFAAAAGRVLTGRSLRPWRSSGGETAAATSGD